MVIVWVSARSIINYGFELGLGPLSQGHLLTVSVEAQEPVLYIFRGLDEGAAAGVVREAASEGALADLLSKYVLSRGKLYRNSYLDISDLTFLLRKSMIAEVSNHLLLQMELNNFIDSCILLTEWSSSRVKSYSDIAKHHFWPSNQSLCDDTKLYINAKCYCVYYVCTIIDKTLVVPTHTKDNRLDVIETVNPLLPLWPLPASVKHSEEKVFVTKVNLHHAARLHSRVQNILALGRYLQVDHVHNILTWTVGV